MNEQRCMKGYCAAVEPQQEQRKGFIESSDLSRVNKRMYPRSTRLEYDTHASKQDINRHWEVLQTDLWSQLSTASTTEEKNLASTKKAFRTRHNGGSRRPRVEGGADAAAAVVVVVVAVAGGWRESGAAAETASCAAASASASAVSSASDTHALLWDSFADWQPVAHTHTSMQHRGDDVGGTSLISRIPDEGDESEQKDWGNDWEDQKHKATPRFRNEERLPRRLADNVIIWLETERPINDFQRLMRKF